MDLQNICLDKLLTVLKGFPEIMFCRKLTHDYLFIFFNLYAVNQIVCTNVRLDVYNFHFFILSRIKICFISIILL